MAVRRATFDELGGFDTAYWNGNEDVDLCLRIGARGGLVVYRPESVVIHHESQSGPERWARVGDNVRLLTERWLGRAVPDIVREADGALRSTDAGRMGVYATPTVALAEPARGPGSVTVVVLTWNALAYTKLCAASLLAHTDPRHELMFVDNGSAADTLEYLDALAAAHPGPRDRGEERPQPGLRRRQQRGHRPGAGRARVPAQQRHRGHGRLAGAHAGAVRRSAGGPGGPGHQQHHRQPAPAGGGLRPGFAGGPGGLRRAPSPGRGKTHRCVALAGRFLYPHATGTGSLPRGPGRGIRPGQLRGYGLRLARVPGRLALGDRPRQLRASFRQPQLRRRQGRLRRFS